MEVKPKIETDFQSNSEQSTIYLPNKAEIQNEQFENFKCSVCKLAEFPGKHLLVSIWLGIICHHEELHTAKTAVQCSKWAKGLSPPRLLVPGGLLISRLLVSRGLLL